MRDGKKLKAVATSGPSAGFLPAAIPLDAFSPRVQKKLAEHKLVGTGEKVFQLRRLPLELGVVRDLNMMLGGGIVVYAEGADLVDQAVACLRFYQSESCGKCVPCRIGSTKMLEIGEAIQRKELTAAEVEGLLSASGGVVLELSQAMAETAICGLGNVAPNPLRTLLSYFPGDLQPYLRARK
jgi:NADH:ubiquinone oxidoreductase subunit F (NADH-binding)